MWLSPVLFLAFAVIWSSSVLAAPDKVICYHATWSTWRPGNGKFTIEDIDTNLCTHINYAFVGINSDGTISLNGDDLGFLDRYRTQLKTRNPKQKILISIGRWSEGSTDFTVVAADPNRRKKLLMSAVDLIKKYNFDGFDFNWEYPGQRGGGSNDKQNFVTLLAEFRTEFNKYGYLLTAAVASTTMYYDVPGIVKSLDFINVMTFNFHGAWETVTGVNALYQDCVNSINAWKNAGAPYNKLILGISAYGVVFTLSNQNNNGIGAYVIGFGNVGPYTQEAGLLAYNEICEYMKTVGWTRKNVDSVPYIYKGNQWISYDDLESIAKKAKFAVDNNLSGMMLWTVDADDFRGICGPRYPLLNAINSGLKLTSPGSGSSSTTTTESSSGSGSGSGSSGGSTGTGVCKSEGYVRDPNDCSKFYYCHPVNGAYNALPFQCGSGLVYDTKTGVCNWPALVPC